MNTDGINQYYILYVTKEGREGREDLPALNDSEAAKAFWASIESGAFKELELYRVHPMLVWTSIGKGAMIQT